MPLQASGGRGLPWVWRALWFDRGGWQVEAAASIVLEVTWLRSLLGLSA